MVKLLKKSCNSKRRFVTYVVIFLWVVMGVIGTYYGSNLTHLAAYFVSLTGFVASYIFGESVRKSSKTSIFLRGPISRREIILYITILLWTIIGIWIIIKEGDMVGASAYFAALTPFVGSYIISETYKAEDDSNLIPTKIEQINS